jgi:NMD protein affecting ribosome stability and mRNA decay
VSVCTRCGGTGQEPVNRWVDTEADQLERAVREDSSARLEVGVTVREPVVADENVLRGEISVVDP